MSVSSARVERNTGNLTHTNLSRKRYPLNGEVSGASMESEMNGHEPKKPRISSQKSYDTKCTDGINDVDGLKQRKLVLHFDVRNTVLVADSVTNVTMEQALNSFLTGVVWGRETADKGWEWHSNTPSLTAPADNTMTFYKFLEQDLVHTPSDRARLRLQTGDFTERESGKEFRPYFDKHMELLRWKYPGEPPAELAMSSKGKHYHYLLPSVYKVIHHLAEQKRDFAIVFRTYGLDAVNVMKSLVYGLQGNHPGFPKHLPLDVNLFPGQVKRNGNGPLEFSTFDANTGKVNAVYTSEREIYDLMSNSTGISAFVDDFACWQKYQYHHSTGKLMYVNPYDRDVQHIIFDDNMRLFEDDSIIDLRIFQTPDSENAKSLSNMEVAKFEHMCVVQADLLQSTDNEDYFVEAVQKCEEKYSEFLKSKMPVHTS